MEGLRWILLGLGAAVLVVVYFASRPTRPRHRRELLEEAGELEKATDIELRAPRRDEDAGIQALHSELSEIAGALREELKDRPAAPPSAPAPPAPRKPAPKTGAAARRPEPEELLIILHVAAHSGERLGGAELLEAFADNDLAFGEMEIFHRMVETPVGRRRLFSVANAVKPGTLIPEQMPSLRTPGVSLFLSLPAPVPAMEAFEAMLECAEALAARLGAELQDETRSALTAQTREHLREKVREWAFRFEHLAPG